MEKPGRVSHAIAVCGKRRDCVPNRARSTADLGTALAREPGSAGRRRFRSFGRPSASCRIRLSRTITSKRPSPVGRDFRKRWHEHQAALRIDPAYADAKANLARASSAESAMPRGSNWPMRARRAGDRGVRSALRLRPELAEAHNNLGVVLSQIPGRQAEGKSRNSARQCASGRTTTTPVQPRGRAEGGGAGRRRWW